MLLYNMLKRTSIEIKKKILGAIKEKPLSFAKLERRIDTGFRTIKSNSLELESFGFVKIEKIKKHSANGRPSFLVKITSRGIEFLNK